MDVGSQQSAVPFRRTVGVLSCINYLNVAIKRLAEAHCQVVAYEANENIVDQVFRQTPDIFILQGECELYDTAQIIGRIKSDIRGQDVAIVLLVPLSVQYNPGIDAYLSDYRNTISSYLTLPVTQIELENLLNK